MENLFKFNVNTEEAVYDKYVVRSVSDETSVKQDSSFDELKNMEKASKLPLWLRIIQLLCYLVSLCLLVGLLRAFGENIGKESFASMWKRFVGNGAIIMIVVGMVCLAVAIALQIWERKRIKRMEASTEFQTVVDEQEKIQAGSYEELGVPSDADSIDVMCFPYKLKRKGKEKNGCQFARYVPISYKIFKQDDSLYFADVSDLIQIPLSAITETYIMAEGVNFYGWNKEQNYNSKEYKQYKIRANKFGTMFIKGCYCINLFLDGNEFEIIIPPYEWQVLEKCIELPKI